MIAGIVRVAVPGLAQSPPGFAPVGFREPLQPRVVLVDDVGEGRHQNQDLCARFAKERHDKEGNVFAGLPGFEHQCIGSGGEVARHRPFVRRRPAAIDNVIIVKVNGCIFLDRVAPAHLPPRPRRARHGPRRHVVKLAMTLLRANVDDLGGGDCLREIPAGDQPRRHFLPGRLFNLTLIKGTVEQHGALDPPIERRRGAIACRRPDQHLRPGGR